MSAIHLFDGTEALLDCAALLWESAVESVLAERPLCHVALSGGTTPVGLYRRLAARNRLPWPRIHFWYGDERVVAPDDPASNHRSAEIALMQPLAIDRRNIHPMVDDPTDPVGCADRYRQLLAAMLPVEREQPRFDLLMLGLGEDGHIASLFPGSPGLEEERLSVVANPVDHRYHWRITLTRPLLNRAGRVIYLASGGNKRDAVARALGPGQPQHQPLPVERLNHSGEVDWLIDRAAAGSLWRGA